MNTSQIMPYDSTPFTVAEQFDITIVEAINVASSKGATKLVLYGILQCQAAQIMQEAIVSISTPTNQSINSQGE